MPPLDLAEYGVAGLLLWFLADRFIRSHKKDQRALARHRKFARRVLPKSDIGAETLAILDDTEPDD